MNHIMFDRIYVLMPKSFLMYCKRQWSNITFKFYWMNKRFLLEAMKIIFHFNQIENIVNRNIKTSVQ